MSALNPSALMALQDSFGLPLNNGYIYFGVVNADPQSNPIVVYWDAALTQIAKQPLRTIYGRVYNNGTPAKLFANGNYSVQVLDQNKVSVLYDLNVAQPVDNPVPVSQGGTGATTTNQALINLGAVAAMVQQTYTAYTAGGTAAAMTLTPVPALVASPANTRFNVTFPLAGSAAPTMSISGLGAKPIVQFNSAGAKVAAAIPVGLVSDMIDDGAGNYLLLDPLPGAGGGGGSGAAVARRQTVAAGKEDVNGLSSFLNGGAALNYNIGTNAGANPLNLTWANGFSGGADVDLIAGISADLVNQGALAFNSTNYAYAAYINSVSATFTNTKAPPQYGYAYDRTKMCVLNFQGVSGSTSIIDDNGNPWAPISTAQLQTVHKFFAPQTSALGGTGGASALNGTSEYVHTTAVTSLGPNVDRSGGWFMRGWFYFTAVPGGGGSVGCFGAFSSAAGFGAGFGVNVPAGTPLFYFALSSNGGSNDIAAQTNGTSPTVLINTPYFLELTYDPIAGKYFAYQQGVTFGNITSATAICAIADMQVGKGGANGTFMQGYVGPWEYGTYCDHPAGVPYVPPTVSPSLLAAAYASEFYDIPAAQMKAITAPSLVANTSPTFGPVSHLYLGELDTNGTNVIAVRNYAYNGAYDQTFPTTGAAVVKNHNIGVQPPGAQILENGVQKYPTGPTLTALTASWTPGTAQYTRLKVDRGF